MQILIDILALSIFSFVFYAVGRSHCYTESQIKIKGLECKNKSQRIAIDLLLRKDDKTQKIDVKNYGE